MHVLKQFRKQDMQFSNTLVHHKMISQYIHHNTKKLSALYKLCQINS